MTAPVMDETVIIRDLILISLARETAYADAVAAEISRLEAAGCRIVSTSEPDANAIDYAQWAICDWRTGDELAGGISTRQDGKSPAQVAQEEFDAAGIQLDAERPMWHIDNVCEHVTETTQAGREWLADLPASGLPESLAESIRDMVASWVEDYPDDARAWLAAHLASS